MKNYLMVILLTIAVMAMVFSGGCSTDIVSIGAGNTPVPEVADPAVRETPVVSAPATTNTVLLSARPSPTLPAECQELFSAADDDKAFIKAMTDNDVYTRISLLSVNECTVGAATEISQVISTSPKPESLLLVKARRQLLSASTYCLDPEDSASRNRTRNDLDRYVSHMSEFAFLSASCQGRPDKNSLALLKKSMEKQGEILFRGTGHDVQYFTVRGYGNSTFFLAHSGTGNFMVMLQDSRVNNVNLLANSAGSFEGKRSLPLDKGRYSLNVTATGPWSVIVTCPE